MKRFCKDLKEHATKIINYEKKEMTPLTSEERNLQHNQKVCYICKKEFSTDDDNGIPFNKKYLKVRDHYHYTGTYTGAAHDICNLRYKTPKEIPVAFHNGSTYDYHFIIKELAKEFNGQFECLGENTEKYITFSVPIKKELDNGKSNTYKIKLIDSFRLSISLLKVVKYLTEKIHSDKCTGTDCKSHFDFMSIKDDQLIFRCFVKRIIRKNSIKN